MTSLYFISLIVFIAYSASIFLAFGILNSVSDSYYKLKDANAGAIFTLFCWITALPLLIFWIDYSPADWNFIPFVACGGLMFVGASPAFKDLKKDLKLEKKVHSTSAIVCAVSAYAWTFLYGNITIGLAAIALSIVPILLRKNRVYWLEMIAFANIYVQLTQRITAI